MPVRERIFPIMCMRPWPNCSELEPIFGKLDESVAGFRYGFDLDRHKLGSISKQPCATQFSDLFDETGGFENYYSVVASNPNRVPVLRDRAGVLCELETQFEHIHDIHNGVVVRIERGYTSGLDELLASNLLVAEDVLFVVDVGWSTDVLIQEVWASNIIKALVDWDETVEIALLSSSFPNSFSHIEHKLAFPIDDRELFARVVRRHNSANLTYGDWGSTRQSEEQGGGTPYPRIDTARPAEWLCFRQTGEEDGYIPVAERVVTDAAWSELPACWGKHAIESTALDIPGRITGTEVAISARINMHVTVQAGAGTDLPPSDEPYVDKF